MEPRRACPNWATLLLVLTLAAGSAKGAVGYYPRFSPFFFLCTHHGELEGDGEQGEVLISLHIAGNPAFYLPGQEYHAEKLEEIYPPKLYQFAYVTDGACTEDDILKMELTRNEESLMEFESTCSCILVIYMQMAYLREKHCEVLLPQYPQQLFVQIPKLLDVFVLDLGCLEFMYGVLAAFALYHSSSTELGTKVSGYCSNELEKCINWMIPFAIALKEVGCSSLWHFRGLALEDLHNIQTHINSLNLLGKAQAK